MKKFIFLLLFYTAFANAQGAYALYDYERREYQVDSNVHDVRSIASITKLFTAITVLNSGVDLNEKIKVKIAFFIL
jgi:D-alanyl-D-alanine carboxypeptidase